MFLAEPVCTSRKYLLCQSLIKFENFGCRNMQSERKRDDAAGRSTRNEIKILREGASSGAGSRIYPRRSKASPQGLRSSCSHSGDLFEPVLAHLGVICRRGSAPIPLATIASFAGGGLVCGAGSDALAAAHDAAVQMIDTSIVRVHQHAACIARDKRQSMGRSRGVSPARYMQWLIVAACR